MNDGFWNATRWYRVLAPDGSLWCETSNREEALKSMREDDTIERLFSRIEYRWSTEIG